MELDFQTVRNTIEDALRMSIRENSRFSEVCSKASQTYLERKEFQNANLYSKDSQRAANEAEKAKFIIHNVLQLFEDEFESYIFAGKQNPAGRGQEKDPTVYIPDGTMRF